MMNHIGRIRTQCLQSIRYINGKIYYIEITKVYKGLISNNSPETDVSDENQYSEISDINKSNTINSERSKNKTNVNELNPKSEIELEKPENIEKDSLHCKVLVNTE